MVHMAFVDPAADPEYIFYAYKRFNFELKDPNFTSEENMFKDVSDKPLIPARKAQITNANYKRHGMKLMILEMTNHITMSSRKMNRKCERNEENFKRCARSRQ